MIQNAKYVMEKIISPEGYAEEAQVGVDLTVKSISRISADYDNCAKIPKEGKTIHSQKHPIFPDKSGFYILEAGSAYDVEFDQGLHPLSKTNTAFIIQRSSLNRNGCIVTGSVFDPGFGCKNLGATAYPHETIEIEPHARIAQIVILDNNSTDLYDGQYKETIV